MKKKYTCIVCGEEHSSKKKSDECCEDSKIICTTCGMLKQEFGYCEEDGSPFCDECWTEHLKVCQKCDERN